MKKYKVEFTEKQLSTVQKACEFYSRFLAGQWRIPDELQYSEYAARDKPSNFWDLRNKTQDLLDKAKEKFFPLYSKHASHGIGHPDLSEYAKLAYDIYRPILEQFAKESNEKAEKEGKEIHRTVYDSPGLSYSKEGRIKIEKL